MAMSGPRRPPLRARSSGSGSREIAVLGSAFDVHFEQDGKVRIVDVWDSEEAYESFREARLLPAMQAVLQRHGAGQPPQPEGSVSSVHRVVRGR
jgi:hypothetical protein